MEMLKVFLLSAGIMAFVFVGMSVKILLKKGGKFPNTHIGGNKNMKARGISCAQTYDKIEQAKVRKEFRFKQISEDLESNSYC
ncbi:MAG: hypothetical protein WAO52_15610 [Prolixibacteraceae bacterium]